MSDSTEERFSYRTTNQPDGMIRTIVEPRETRAEFNARIEADMEQEREWSRERARKSDQDGRRVACVFIFLAAVYYVVLILFGW